MNLKTLLVASVLLLIQSASGSQDQVVFHQTSDEAVPGQYVIMLNAASGDGLELNAIIDDIMRPFENTEGVFVMKRFPNGFSAQLSPEALVHIDEREEVDFIEPNYIYRVGGIQFDPPSWGLPRTFQKTFSITNQYRYPDTAGEHVDVYVIDTGIYVGHADFEGRAIWGYNSIDSDDTDGNGHGTHVSSTIVGKIYGIAKKARVFAVKVLDAGGSGTLSDVIDGINWVTGTVQANGRKSVVNMSLGGTKSVALNNAVAKAVAAGIPFVVAAGNNADDACKYSPAMVPGAITVAASDKVDARASFSNAGKCVDVFAPGSGITGAWMTFPNAKKILSGTSMATPHVAGVVALYLGKFGDLSPPQVKGLISTYGFEKVLKQVPGDTVNLLINNGYLV